MRHSPRRKLIVAGRKFIWTLAGNTLYAGNRHIVVRPPGLPGRILIDPFPWSLEIRPASIATAVEFALSIGWNPAKKVPPLILSYERGAFFVLPPGVKFSHDLPDF